MTGISGLDGITVDQFGNCHNRQREETGPAGEEE